MSYPGYRLSQQVSLLAWEWRRAIDFAVKVASKQMLDVSSVHQSVRMRLWQLHPVIGQTVAHPVDMSVGSFAPFLLTLPWLFLLEIECSLSDPVVLLGAVNLSPEPEAGRSGHGGESLEGFLEQVGNVFPKVNASPRQHLGLFGKIW